MARMVERRGRARRRRAERGAWGAGMRASGGGGGGGTGGETPGDGEMFRGNRKDRGCRCGMCRTSSKSPPSYIEGGAPRGIVARRYDRREISPCASRRVRRKRTRRKASARSARNDRFG